jgi:hypothetical protein
VLFGVKIDYFTLMATITAVYFIASSLPSFQFLDFVVKKNCKNGLCDFQTLLWKGCVQNNIKDFYYAILDTFIAVIPWKYFFSGFALKNSFFYELKKIIKKYEIFYLNFNTLFLADTAYFDSYLAKHIFLKNNKKVIYLNPIGKIAQYNSISDSEFGAKNYHNSYAKYSAEIEKYLIDRYMGKKNNEIDSKLAFSKNKKKSSIKKKVLFLHIFRDANNLNWSKKQFFDSHYEWTEFTFKTIYDIDDFNNWYIKVHPSSKFYANENKILKKFIQQYNIPLSTFKDCPSTLDILEQKMPVYSNGGTIILETATKGYGTYFCNTRYNKNYGFYISSKNKWKKIVSAPYKKVQNFNISKKRQIAAKFTLWYIYKQNIPELCRNEVLFHNNNTEQLMKIFNQCHNALFHKSRNTSIPKIL